MRIQLTEGKTDHPENNERVVRVFFEGDSGSYGYFVPENLVYGLLSKSQKSEYSSDNEFHVSKETVSLMQLNGFTYPPK